MANYLKYNKCDDTLLMKFNAKRPDHEKVSGFIYFNNIHSLKYPILRVNSELWYRCIDNRIWKSAVPSLYEHEYNIICEMMSILFCCINSLALVEDIIHIIKQYIV